MSVKNVSRSSVKGRQVSQVKVGDILVEQDRYGKEWRVVGKVTKITPSGQIVCGDYRYNKDLRRTASGHWSGYCYADVMTPEIRENIIERKRKEKALSVVLGQNWRELSTTVLERVVEALRLTHGEEE